MLEPDYFAKRRSELGFERVDELAKLQAWCEEQYPGLVRVRQLHQGTLRIITPSSGVAGELRMRQIELLGVLGKPGTRLQISIANL